MSRLRSVSISLLVLFMVASATLFACSSRLPFSAVAATNTPHPTASATPRPNRPKPTATRTPIATSTLKAYFLDVGQGDSILLAGPDFTILIDTGRQDRNEVVPYLKEIGVKSIHLLVGTHPHADHIGQF